MDRKKKRWKNIESRKFKYARKKWELCEVGKEKN
jgi:hypothetical protein